MGLLDSVVNRSFADEKAGRVVVFPGDRRTRGYVVKSDVDELRIKGFLKLFYVSRSLVVLLGLWLAAAWSKDINRALGGADEHLLRTSCIVLGTYLLTMGVPYLLVGRAYEDARLNFVSAQDEVLISESGVTGRHWAVLIAVITLGVAIVVLFIFHVIQHK